RRRRWRDAFGPPISIGSRSRSGRPTVMKGWRASASSRTQRGWTSPPARTLPRRPGFGRSSRRGAGGYLRPPLSRARAPSAGALQVYALAAAHGVTIVPHCAYLGQGHLASLHLAASLPQAVPFERLFLDLEASPLSPWTEANDGILRVPDGPGLGCDPDMKLV